MDFIYCKKACKYDCLVFGLLSSTTRHCSKNESREHYSGYFLQQHSIRHCSKNESREHYSGYFLQQHSIRHCSKNESREHCCSQQFYACLGDLRFSHLIEHGKASTTVTTSLQEFLAIKCPVGLH